MNIFNASGDGKAENFRHAAPLGAVEGFLTRKRGLMKGKMKCYFKLQSELLQCFKNVKDDLIFELGMDGANVSRDPKKNIITITWTDRKEVLVAANTEDFEHWAVALEKSSKNNIENYYEMGEMLGEGAFAKVVLGVDKGTLEKFAVKIIKKESADKQELEFIRRELNIMRNVNHDRVLRTHDIFDTTKFIYIVLEYMPAGTLSDVFRERGKPTEPEVKEVAQDILLGLQYLHKKGIVHRDLKLKNILCKSKEPPLESKLADFGLSNFVAGRTRQSMALKSQVGSPHYVAPEVLEEEPYGPPVDLWSCGVILYILLSGKYPFAGETIQDTLEMVVSARISMNDEAWDEVSSEAKFLVAALLKRNPRERLTATQALEHEWFKENNY